MRQTYKQKWYRQGYKTGQTNLIKELEKYLSDYSIGAGFESGFGECFESHRSGIFEAIRDFEKKLKQVSESQNTYTIYDAMI